MKREIDTVPSPAHVKPKKLVVLSAPRTGTHGLYLALKQLGFTPYHMAEVLAAGSPALRIMTDEMPFFMLRSTLKSYPDAKFLLTERDPEKWAKSYMNTIGVASTRLNQMPMSVFKKFDGFASNMDEFGGRMMNYCTNGFGVSEEGCEALVENFKSYIADVKRLVPPEQLMVIKLEDGLGWNELCPYLGVPIPDTPWPSLNTPEEFHAIIGPKMQKAVSKGIAGVTTIIAVAAVAMWYCQKNLLPLLR
ncbi:hypothetical protein CHU98_g9280 [Xylaria longipes]|nr:hypothetical protein CHU98_g9280 [Xylaria longipes]